MSDERVLNILLGLIFVVLPFYSLFSVFTITASYTRGKCSDWGNFLRANFQEFTFPGVLSSTDDSPLLLLLAYSVYVIRGD